jgi:murein DD-endopeptidase MepM/ murein hydrolase activator NlpD
VVFVYKARFLCSVAVISLLASACTRQDAAEIVYKGSQFFGHDHEEEAAIDSPNNKVYSADAPKYKPGYARSVEPAEVPEVSVTDLPPPSSTASAKTLAKQEPAAGKQDHTLKVKESSISSVEVKEQPVVASVKEAKTKSDVKEMQMASLDEKLRPAQQDDAVTSNAHPKFIWPVDGGKIISHFKPSADKAKSNGNDGINIAMSEGEPIFSAADGTVVYAGNELKGYGNMVIVRHAEGWMTAYAHARSLAVKKGEKVKQGALIAYVGSTGGVKVPQVHFAMRKGKTPVDPVKYLPKA